MGRGGKRNREKREGEVKTKDSQKSQHKGGKQKKQHKNSGDNNNAKNSTPRVIKSTTFSHLKESKRSKFKPIAINDDIINHPQIIQLGYQYKNGTIQGSNARTMALLNALKAYFQDFNAENADVQLISKHLDKMVNFLNICRPLSISMGNALNDLKYHIFKDSQVMNFQDKKEQLIEFIENYVDQRIKSAISTIVDYGLEHIHDGDIIITYARSISVQRLLIEAHKQGRNFSVVVVDSSPRYEGKTMLRNLSSVGISCEYVVITGLGYILNTRKPTKFIVGAHAMLMNGACVSRVGTAQVAMMCASNHIPVIVCCETYKFSSKTAVNPISSNELAPDDDWIGSERVASYKKWKSLDVLNIMYDTTPCSNIQMIISDRGCIPPTSTPVILREFNSSSKFR